MGYNYFETTLLNLVPSGTRFLQVPYVAITTKGGSKSKKLSTLK